MPKKTKKIKVVDLKDGMSVKGLSIDGSKADKSFANPHRINAQGDINTIISKGYRYAYIEMLEEPSGKGGSGKALIVETLGREVGEGGERLEFIGGWELPYGEGEVEDRDLIDADKATVEDLHEEAVVPEIPFSEEIIHAQEVKEEAGNVVRDFMEDARTGRGIETGKAKEVVAGMIESVFRNQDALLSLARLKDYDNYTFGHSVNVSILALALGRYLGLSRAELYQLGTGALLHDTGKMLVPDTILNKPTSLTLDEFDEIKKHVTYSMEILTKSGNIDERSVNIAYQHHEKFNGSGYPNGLAGEEIDYFGRLVSIVDVYDALTSKRVYEPDNKTANVAVKMIFSVKGQHFDPALLGPFVKCLGIYPVGSFVSLNTGETALVKSTNRKNLLKPTVLVIYDIYKIKLKAPYEINLSHIPSVSIGSSVNSPISEVEISKYLD